MINLKIWLATTLLAVAATTTWAAPVRLLMETSQGDITLELDADKAPKTVENFLGYVDTGFYDGTIFHRVIKGFMIQGGGFTADMTKKPTNDPIPNEADNGLANSRGTIAMARTPDPDSATAQFFINHKDNASLNHTAKTPRGWGYAVFGQVVEGMSVVDSIAGAATGAKKGMRDVPLETVTIERVSRIEPAAEAAK
ncbi:MAG: peptidylprolyl isomerase [Pseudomonadota bacterium]